MSAVSEAMQETADRYDTGPSRRRWSTTQEVDPVILGKLDGAIASLRRNAIVAPDPSFELRDAMSLKKIRTVLGRKRCEEIALVIFRHGASKAMEILNVPYEVIHAVRAGMDE